jgi:hypothetical protein
MIEENITFGRNIEHQICKVHISPKPITIINIYRNCTAESNAALSPQKLFDYMSKQKSAMAVGDFNAKHPLWKNIKTLTLNILNQTTIIPVGILYKH